MSLTFIVESLNKGGVGSIKDKHHDVLLEETLEALARYGNLLVFGMSIYRCCDCRTLETCNAHCLDNDKSGCGY